ncbi:MAG: hypothetical protein Terrestrivirus1_291 [Terrestrivirus sp.]|uniref:Ankyrin repeat protein n=1 Tax=Terrestrivirus sp. TaxID=2487775 RepID=A0A3G4ZKQ4_9VIRU|nr:MAG: hypothetical protein Terrestrivirus1_291 [Terrestrivirus sp.]
MDNKDGYWFVIACHAGNIDEAKKIYARGTITTKNLREGWGECCYMGHQELAEWIYSLKVIGIMDEDDYIAQKAYQGKQFDLLRWLCSLCPEYLERIRSE